MVRRVRLRGLNDYQSMSFEVNFRWTPHPVIVTIRNSGGYIRVLLYSYYTTIPGSGVLLRYNVALGFV